MSFKRKLRDLVDAKDAPIWQELSVELGLGAENFEILESKKTKRAEVRKLSAQELLDVRLVLYDQDFFHVRSPLY